jgi:hypothetical protein
MDWTKSSYSAPNGDCVEVGTDDGPAAAIRNSNHPDRTTLALPTGVVADFVRACAAGDLDELTT